jgi:iron complex outermembrane receptor protein
MRSWLVPAVCLLAPAVALADEPPPAAAVVLDEIEVKARQDTRVETLEDREVHERSATDLGEALAAQGAAARVRRGAIGGDVVLRWFERDDLAVAIDGAPVHGACPNRMDPPAFHIDYAEVGRVEVKRGPFDVTAPGGLGGSVAVEARRPRPGPNVEGNLSGGSNRHLEGSAILGYGGGRADLLGSYAYKLGAPYEDGDGTSMTAVYPVSSPNRYRDTGSDRAAYRIHTAWLRGGAALAGEDRLELAYTFQSAADVLYPYLLMDAVSDDTHRVKLGYRRGRSGPLDELAAQLSFSNVEHLMNDTQRCSSTLAPGSCDGALDRPYSMETDAAARVIAARLEARVDRVQLGVDGYARFWDATTTRYARPTAMYGAQASIPEVLLVDVGAFARAERRLGASLRLSAGVRLDVARSQARLDRLDAAQADTVRALYDNAWGAGQPLATTDLLPGGNLELDWTVTPATSLYLGVGHAARPPSPVERYFALSGMAAMGSTPARSGRVGAPDLAPPRNTEADLGVKVATRRLIAKAQLFAANVTDAVVVGGITGADGVPYVTSKNVTARLAGGEASARLALPGDLYASVGASYTHAWNVTSGEPLQETPPLAAAVSLRWDDGRLFVELEERLAAPQERVDATVGEERTDGWAITNLRAGATFHGLQVMAAVSNVFGARYVEHLSYLRDPYSSGVRVAEPGMSVGVTLQYAHE